MRHIEGHEERFVPVLITYIQEAAERIAKKRNQNDYRDGEILLMNVACLSSVRNDSTVKNITKGAM